MVSQKQQKRTRKGELISPLLKLGDGTQELTQKNEKKREQTPPMLELGNGTHLHP